jgi:hypothetical protein
VNISWGPEAGVREEKREYAEIFIEKIAFSPISPSLIMYLMESDGR